MTPSPAYEALREHFRRLSHLDHAAAILSWDESVMMPRGGGSVRAEAMGALAEVRHAQHTAKELAELIARAKLESLEPWAAANVRRIEDGYERACALPASLVRRREEAQARCQQIWREARGRNDFASLRPSLEEVVTYEREAAQALGDRLGLDPYDALLSQWDPGSRRARIDPLFAELEGFLPSFVAEAVEVSERQVRVVVPGPFPVDAQRRLALRVMQLLGFDFEHGRLDESHHPFCGGVPEDVRLTTRYDERTFLPSLFGVLHETGHALYEQGLRAGEPSQPVGAACGMAVHESQSLFWEMQVGRNPAFLSALAPLVQEAFLQHRERLHPDQLQRLVTRVERSKIRVDADEATYPCHVLLRYAIERDLIAGVIEVRDLPERWRVGMLEFLAIDTAGDDKDGCMQDVHWPAGAFGYFPSYTLGAMIAAQLFAALRREQPDLDGCLQRGELEPLRAFLAARVWRLGSMLDPDDLVREATGEPLGTAAYRNHLRRRFLEASPHA